MTSYSPPTTEPASYLENRPYIFSAMTTFLDSAEKGDAAITAASRAAFEYFSRLSHASEYGRAIR